MAERHGEVTTTLFADNTLVSVTSNDDANDCCYQAAWLDKEDVAELIERLTALHSQMVDS